MNKLKKRGFSLMVTLVLLLLALACIGGVMHITESNATAGRRASAKDRKYNLLVSAVEEARAELVAILDSTEPPPRRLSSGSIVSADMLLIRPVSDTSLTRRELALYGMNGESGVLSVRIFDMQYDPDPDISPAQLRLLPPSLKIKGSPTDGGGGPISEDDLPPGGGDDDDGGTSANGGAYLIRATLTIDGRDFGNVEMAMIGSNRES